MSISTEQESNVQVYGFEVFINQAVNYPKIKAEFKEKLNKKLPKADDKRIGIWLNMSALVQKVKYRVDVGNGTFATLDELAEALKIKKTGKKETERNTLTITRIARAYADETREFLRTNSELIKIPELGELGFPNSYMCSDLTDAEYVNIYKEVTDWEDTWEDDKKTTRFSDNIYNYGIKIRKMKNALFRN
jgi:hypothetical protein